MPIDNTVLLRFCNETIRPTADKLAGLLPQLPVILGAVTGQGIAALLGTDDRTIQRPEPWGDADYGAVHPDTIAGSDEGGRTTLLNYDVIAFLRVLVVLKQMVDANPAILALLGKIAVNPRV